MKLQHRVIDGGIGPSWLSRCRNSTDATLTATFLPAFCPLPRPPRRLGRVYYSATCAPISKKFVLHISNSSVRVYATQLGAL